jgi:hypothetical protein
VLYAAAEMGGAAAEVEGGTREGLECKGPGDWIEDTRFEKTAKDACPTSAAKSTWPDQKMVEGGNGVSEERRGEERKRRR